MKARTNFVKSSINALDRPVVCFIPGGPGLSSATLRSMDLLSRSFDLAYIDPPGTGGLEVPENPTFYGIAEALESEVASLQRKVILCGHSFGALYGIELCARRRLNLAGFVAIASPFSRASYAVASKRYAELMTPELVSAATTFETNPSLTSLRDLLAAYRSLYFSSKTVESGSEMLRHDKACVKTFQNVLSVISEGTPNIDFIENLKGAAIRKFFLAGELDLLLPAETLLDDANATGCLYRVIQNAGHFIGFDQPEAVARFFEEVFVDGA